MFKTGIRCKVLSSGKLSSFEYGKYALLFEKAKLDVHVIYRPLGHAYADDRQLFCSFHPDSMDNDCESIELCVSDIISWMQSMNLNINDSKTEYILISTPQQLAKCTNTSINIRGNVVHASDCVRNFKCHIKSKCREAYAQLYNIGKIKKYLDHQSAERTYSCVADRFAKIPNKEITDGAKHCCVELVNMTT